MALKWWICHRGPWQYLSLVEKIQLSASVWTCAACCYRAVPAADSSVLWAQTPLHSWQLDTPSDRCRSWSWTLEHEHAKKTCTRNVMHAFSHKDGSLQWKWLVTVSEASGSLCRNSAMWWRSRGVKLRTLDELHCSALIVAYCSLRISCFSQQMSFH